MSEKIDKQHVRDTAGVRIIAVIAMLILIFSILLTSFQLAIYGDSEYRFYQKEYEKYYVTHSLNMKMEDVMDVTEYMMDYLIGKEEVLSIITDVDGQRKDFFNEQDRLHMEDVRNLFQKGILVRNVCAIIGLILLGLLIARKANWKYLLPHAYSVALAIFVALIIFLGGAIAIDFTECFTIFHELLFTNDLWLFDPSTDYMIRMLPEGFFFDMAIRIGKVFIVLLSGIWILFEIWKRMVKRRK